MDGDQLSSGEVLVELLEFILVVAMIGLVFFGAKYLDRKINIEKGRLSHRSAYHFGFLFLAMPVGALLSEVSAAIGGEGYRIQGFSPLDTVSALVILPAILGLGYGLLALKRWAIYIMGIGIATFDVILLAMIVGFKVEQEIFRWILLIIGGAFLFLQGRSALKYVQERWHEYR